MTTVRSLLVRTASRLGSASEARWIIEHALGSGSSVHLLASGGAGLTGDVEARVDAMVERRLAGEPVQYILGRWAFRHLDLAVDSRVLIPRPETEVVAGYALDLLGHTKSDPVVAVDLGTGSGAIALALATEGPAVAAGRRIEVWAVDNSSEALGVARDNWRHTEPMLTDPEQVRLELAQGSWFEALPADLEGRVDLVVSNPPYISEAEWEGLDPSVRDHEPRPALVPGPEGTEALELIIDQAPKWLVPGGSLVLELAPHQAHKLSVHAFVAGFDAVLVRNDLAGRPRALIAVRPFA